MAFSARIASSADNYTQLTTHSQRKCLCLIATHHIVNDSFTKNQGATAVCLSHFNKPYY